VYENLLVCRAMECVRTSLTETLTTSFLFRFFPSTTHPLMGQPVINAQIHRRIFVILSLSYISSSWHCTLTTIVTLWTIYKKNTLLTHNYMSYHMRINNIIYVRILSYFQWLHYHKIILINIVGDENMCTLLHWQVLNTQLFTYFNKWEITVFFLNIYY